MSIYIYIFFLYNLSVHIGKIIKIIKKINFALFFRKNEKKLLHKSIIIYGEFFLISLNLIFSTKIMQKSFFKLFFNYSYYVSYLEGEIIQEDENKYIKYFIYIIL